MKNISRLFIILLAIVFLLLAGNVVPSQAATSLVMDEYGTGFYNANDGTGWHEWPSEMFPDPFGNVLPMFPVPVMDLPAPYYLDIVAVENGITIDSAEISKIMGGDLTDVSDVVRLVDWPLLAPLFPPDYPGPYFGLYVLYSNNSDGVNAPADVGLTNLIPISPITPFIPGFIVNEQLNGTFSVTFPDGTTLLYIAS